MGWVKGAFLSRGSREGPDRCVDGAVGYQKRDKYETQRSCHLSCVLRNVKGLRWLCNVRSIWPAQHRPRTGRVSNWLRVIGMHPFRLLWSGLTSRDSPASPGLVQDPCHQLGKPSRLIEMCAMTRTIEDDPLLGRSIEQVEPFVS